MMRPWLPLLVVFGCDRPDEWTCELEVNGVEVCVDQHSRKYCESEWGGTATPSEREPGGPYVYCRDLYEVTCTGGLVENGENFTAEHVFNAATEEDCATADGGTIGG
jgi:hypothetical protein